MPTRIRVAEVAADVQIRQQIMRALEADGRTIVEVVRTLHHAVLRRLPPREVEGRALIAARRRQVVVEGRAGAVDLVDVVVDRRRPGECGTPAEACRKTVRSRACSRLA